MAKGLHHPVTVTLGKTFDRERKAFALIRLELAEPGAVGDVEEVPPTCQLCSMEIKALAKGSAANS